MNLKSIFILTLLSLSSLTHASWVSGYLEWTNIALGNARVQGGNYIYRVTDSNSLEQLRLNYGSLALKQIYANMSTQEIMENNENVVALSKDDINFSNNINDFRPLPDALTELTEDQVNELYYAMSGTYVVRNQRSYGGLGVGFCFGRALVAHNQALIRNVHPASIRKIWVIGNMGFWGHHVATIVKVKGDWMAVDDFTGVMTVEEWVQRMQHEKDGKSAKPLMFFITRAGRFGHANNNLYNTIDLFNVPMRSIQNFASTEAKERLKQNDFYQGFFMDFYEELDEKATIVRRFSQQEANLVAAEEARIEAAIRAEQERIAAAQKLSDVSKYKLNQETTYCYNAENKKLNCNYGLENEAGAYETSVSITGFAQYLVQKQEGETIYASHIVDEEVEGAESYHISVDEAGKATKRIVEYIRPENRSERPFYIVLETIEGNETDDEMLKDINKVKDIVAKFDPRYLVKTEDLNLEISK